MNDQEIALLIGELKGTMISVQATILDLHKEIKTVSIDVRGLPCVKHTQEIDTLRGWMDGCKARTAVETKSRWDFKTELAKGGLIVFGGILTLIMTWILTGKL